MPRRKGLWMDLLIKWGQRRCLRLRREASGLSTSNCIRVTSGTARCWVLQSARPSHISRIWVPREGGVTLPVFRLRVLALPSLQQRQAVSLSHHIEYLIDKSTRGPFHTHMPPENVTDSWCTVMGPGRISLQSLQNFVVASTPISASGWLADKAPVAFVAKRFRFHLTSMEH